jgi:predicted RND superfamily exporter protein
MLSLIISLPFLISLPKVQTAENVDIFIVEGDPDIEYYEQFKKEFGNDEFFLIAFQDENIFTEKNLSLLQDITTRIENIDEVRTVISLATVDDMIGEEDYFLVQKFLHEIPSDPEALAELKNKAVNNPLYRGRLISKDGTTTAVIAYVYDRPEDGDYRKRLMEKTFTLLREYEKQDKRFYVTGWTITNLRLSEYMKSDVGKFIPLVYLIIITTIFIIFRNLKIAIISFGNVSLCLSCTMGFIALAGSDINNVTTIVPPLIMALSLADTIHVFTHYLANLRKGRDTDAAILKAVREVYRPCLLTSLTTIAGFLSLRLSNIPAIQDFAIISSMGILLAFVFSFLFLPALIVLFSPSSKGRGEDSKMFIDRILRGVERLNARRGPAVLIVCITVVVAALALVSMIRVETDLIKFFKKNDELRQATQFIEKNLGGTAQIDISIRGKSKDAFKEPGNLHFIEDIQNHIASFPEIDTVISLADYVKDMNESFHNENKSYDRIPETRELIAQYLLLYDSDDIDEFINSSYDHARIRARTDRHSTRDQEIIIERIARFLRGKTPNGLEARVTGGVVQIIKISSEIVRSQIMSLASAVLVISIMMFLVFRSFKFGLLSIIPNIFPIIMNFGIMGVLGIPLNTATALISAVAIGIAVDDTIHFLYNYREERREKRERMEAIQNTIRIKGKAMMTTSIIMAAGFGVLMFSSFSPTIHFGSLTAFIMISALAGDLLLLPAILAFGKKYLP